MIQAPARLRSRPWGHGHKRELTGKPVEKERHPLPRSCLRKIEGKGDGELGLTGGWKPMRSVR
jgi:hypothetical protein